jgi:hypothetical protein
MSGFARLRGNNPISAENSIAGPILLQSLCDVIVIEPAELAQKPVINLLLITFFSL